MHWLNWAVVGVLAVNILVVIGFVGKPRQPITSATAVVSTIFTALLIVAILVANLD